MAYIHNGTKPITLKESPIDDDSSDWVYFVHDQLLRSGETITSHAAEISGGSILVDSTFLESMIDSNGVVYNHVYAVKIEPDPSEKVVTVTHRVSTTTTGDVDLGRTNIGFSVMIPIVKLL